MDNKLKILSSVVATALLTGAGISAVPEQRVYEHAPLTADYQQQNIQRDWNSVTHPIEATIVKDESWLLPTKTLKVKETRFVSQIIGGWQNYLDVDGWKPLNTKFVETTTDFEMTGAPFKVYLPKTADGVAIFKNDNRYDIFNKIEIKETPFNMTIQAEGVSPVLGKMASGTLMIAEGQINALSYVIYEGAYPQGDLIYYVHPGRAPKLEKLIRFNSEPLIKKYSFKLSFSQDPNFWREVLGQDSEWSKTVTLSVPKGKRLATKISETRGVGFKSFHIWDSAIGSPRKDISVEFTSLGSGEYRMTKLLPSLFFASATYPVYTDTINTYIPDATESTTMDGYAAVTNQANTAWATLRGVAGTASGLNDVKFDAGRYNTNVGAAGDQYKGIFRSLSLFDASALPDTDTINATSDTNIVIKGTGDVPGASLSLNISSSTPASNTSIANGDFNQTGITAYSTAIASASWDSTLGNSNTFILNASGILEISLTGISRFSVKLGGDITNTAPPAGSDLDGGFKVFGAENGSNVTTLSIDHTAVTSDSPQLQWNFIQNESPLILALQELKHKLIPLALAN